MLLVLFILSMSATGSSNVEEMKTQERLFLNSLGLSVRPRPSEHRQVPSVLWRMFQRSSGKDNEFLLAENDPCVVSEYGVRGNIVRFVQDQGEVWKFLEPFCDFHSLLFSFIVLGDIDVLFPD